MTKPVDSEISTAHPLNKIVCPILKKCKTAEMAFESICDAVLLQ